MAAWQPCKGHRDWRGECQATDPASKHHSYVLREASRNRVHTGFDSTLEAWQEPSVWVHLPALHPCSQSPQTNLGWTDIVPLSRTQDKQGSSTSPENSNKKEQALPVLLLLFQPFSQLQLCSEAAGRSEGCSHLWVPTFLPTSPSAHPQAGVRCFSHTSWLFVHCM